MEFRQLTASDLDSLLELYKQLSSNDAECTKERYETVWNYINVCVFGISHLLFKRRGS